MKDEQEAIDKARRQLEVERKNMAAEAAGRETILNAKQKEINAWEKAQTFANSAQARADELRKIVESHTIEIVKFKSRGRGGDLVTHPECPELLITRKHAEGLQEERADDPEYPGPRASEQAKGRGIRSGCPTPQPPSASTEAQRVDRDTYGGEE